MSEHPPDRIWSGIDIVKVTAGTLAAVSAAVIGSFLGVAGTLIGAAIASLVGTVGTEVFAKSISRGYSRLRGTSPAQPPVTAPAAVGTPAVAMPSTAKQVPGHFDPVPQPGSTTQSARPRWRRLVLPAIAVFVLAMGAVTLVELTAGKSFASMFGNESGGGTTLTSVGREDDPTPTPDVTRETPDPDQTEQTPTDTPTDEAPTGPTPTTTSPTTGAPDVSPEPTAQDPQGPGDQEAPGGEGPGDQGGDDQAPAPRQAPAGDTSAP